jgi:hypothetical protein
MKIKIKIEILFSYVIKSILKPFIKFQKINLYYNKMSGTIAPIDCPICMDCIESTSKNCVTTECGHCFHTNCLMKSVAHNGFGCPYCRTAMAEQPEEDDDDSFWADEDDEVEEVFNDYALRGFRFFFNNLNGQPHDEDDIAEEDQADESISDEEQVNSNNIPSTEIVAQKLREQGVTFDQLVKMICALDHHGYDQHEEEAEEFEEKLHGMVEKIVADYKPEPVAQPSVDLEAQPKSVNVRLVEE